MAACGKTCKGAARQETGELGMVAYTLIPGLRDQGRTGLHTRQSQIEREKGERGGRIKEKEKFLIPNTISSTEGRMPSFLRERGVEAEK